MLKKNPDANIQKEKKIKEGRKKKGKKQDSCTLASYFIRRFTQNPPRKVLIIKNLL